MIDSRADPGLKGFAQSVCESFCDVIWDMLGERESVISIDMVDTDIRYTVGIWRTAAGHCSKAHAMAFFWLGPDALDWAKSGFGDWPSIPAQLAAARDEGWWWSSIASRWIFDQSDLWADRAWSALAAGAVVQLFCILTVWMACSASVAGWFAVLVLNTAWNLCSWFSGDVGGLLPFVLPPLEVGEPEGLARRQDPGPSLDPLGPLCFRRLLDVAIIPCRHGVGCCGGRRSRLGGVERQLGGWFLVNVAPTSCSSVGDALVPPACADGAETAAKCCYLPGFRGHRNVGQQYGVRFLRNRDV
jgi:hypothetical protein